MLGIKKIKFWLWMSFNALLILTALIAYINKDWINIGLCAFTLFLTFLPNLVEKKLKVDIPTKFEMVILTFIILSMYLGEIEAFYQKFWWWDVVLHGLAGIIIGIIGFALIYILNQKKLNVLKLSPAFLAVFAFSFAISIGVFWEIFEFSMDTFFKINMQKSGLVDTMWDLILDTSGALLVSSIGYFYLKKNKKLFQKIFKRCLKKNNR